MFEALIVGLSLESGISAVLTLPHVQFLACLMNAFWPVCRTFDVLT